MKSKADILPASETVQLMAWNLLFSLSYERAFSRTLSLWNIIGSYLVAVGAIAPTAHCFVKFKLLQGRVFFNTEYLPLLWSDYAVNIHFHACYVCYDRMVVSTIFSSNGCFCVSLLGIPLRLCSLSLARFYSNNS